MAEAGLRRLGAVREALDRQVRERPYPTLALAAAVGYVAGGGLFSRLTRPMARAAMGALLVPSFRARVRGFAEELRPTQATGTA